MKDQLKVCHVITGLPVGGAQTVLHQLVAHRRRLGCEMEVISLTETGPVGKRIQELGVRVRALGMSGISPVPPLRLTAWLRRSAPDIVQTWLYHADLVGGLAARVARVPTVHWNLRQTDLDPTSSKVHTRLAVTACARISHNLPDRIVCCSEASREVHVALGYDDSRMLVLGNGVDVSSFRPDPRARAEVRDELAIEPHATLIGLIARFHAQKDHRTFIRAAAALSGGRTDVKFLLCGEDVVPSNAQLARWIEQAGIGDRVHLLGLRPDAARITAALDIATSASAFGEGFSNAVIEAMACGVPCVVTEVGDSARIVGDTGMIVPPREPEALARALGDMIDEVGKRKALGRAARERVVTHFSVEAMIAGYRDLYASWTPAAVG